MKWAKEKNRREAKERRKREQKLKELGHTRAKISKRMRAKVSRAATIKYAAGRYVCEDHNTPLVGRLYPYRVASAFRREEVVRSWLWCEKEHWCLFDEPTKSAQTMFIERGALKQELDIVLGRVEDTLSLQGVPIYDTGMSPTTNRTTPEERKVLTQDQELSHLISQIVGCHVAVVRGRNVSRAQVEGVERKFDKTLETMTHNEKTHWNAKLENRLKGHGLQRLLREEAV